MQKGKNFMVKLKAPPRLLTLGALFLGGALTACARISGVPLPFGTCWVAALSAAAESTRKLPRHAALFAWLGVAVSASVCQTEAGLYNAAAGLLVLTVCRAFSDSRFFRSPYWLPLSALVCGGIASLLLLLSAGLTPRSVTAFFVQLAFLPIGAAAAARVLESPKGPALYLCLFALISGSAAVGLPGGISVGSILAAGVVFSLSGTQLALPMAAVAGLALDWGGVSESSAVTVLAAAGLAAGAAAQLRQSRWLQLLFFCGGAAVSILLSGGGSGELLLTFLAGGLFAALLPPLPVTERGELQMQEREQLEHAAGAMAQLAREFSDVPVPESHTDMSGVYDRAAARVCARCARFGFCWRQERAETRRLFSDAAETIDARGFCVRTDYPENFVHRCRHFAALQKAINGELDAAARRRQLARRRSEQQQVLCGQYRILADYLRGLYPPIRPAPPRYEVQTYTSSFPRVDAASGDLIRELRQGARYYFLLCDGMGTGGEAAEDSRRAAELLLSLLRADMEPDDALELLNGVAILREEGGFSTVDLLCADLRSGDAVLYKWGGAPSYLRKGDQLKKIGTASFPPGLGVGGTQQAQRIRLSLGRGEVLILTSDGVGGEEAERLCRSAGEEALAGLAGQLAASGSREGADDRTAAVVSLLPLSTH